MKRGHTCEWDLPLIFYQCLSTKHSTSSRKYKYFYDKGHIQMGTTIHTITIIQDPTRNAQTTHAKIVKQVMLINLWELYAPGLALLKRRVTLLTTCGLWTTRNLLFHLLLLWKGSSNHGSYM
jgi:hypothetical protein